VGALTHEGGLSGRDIGRIGLMDHYSHVDLPAALSESTIRRLARIHVAQRRLELTLETPELVHARAEASESPRKDHRAGPPRGEKPARAAGRKPGFAKPTQTRGGEKPPRKPRAFSGPSKASGRGPGAGKPPVARTARNAGTIAIRRKPV